MLHRYYTGATLVRHWSYSGTILVLYWYYMGTTPVLQSHNVLVQYQHRNRLQGPSCGAWTARLPTGRCQSHGLLTAPVYAWSACHLARRAFCNHWMCMCSSIGDKTRDSPGAGQIQMPMATFRPLMRSACGIIGCPDWVATFRSCWPGHMLSGVGRRCRRMQLLPEVMATPTELPSSPHLQSGTSASSVLPLSWWSRFALCLSQYGVRSALGDGTCHSQWCRPGTH